MSLQTYTRKRNFARTPEPQGEIGKTNTPVFVVQKHWATHLHYDFRLEIGGVLKSWAVPKGPSMNPKDKRLAVMTEDHPLEYKDFSGIIPRGNYGAGEVEIWDKGPYLPASGAAGDLQKELAEGHISIVLLGKKIFGEFVLLKLEHSKKGNEWLLIKAHDEYAEEL